VLVARSLVQQRLHSQPLRELVQAILSRAFDTQAEILAGIRLAMLVQGYVALPAERLGLAHPIAGLMVQLAAPVEASLGQRLFALLCLDDALHEQCPAQPGTIAGAAQCASVSAAVSRTNTSRSARRRVSQASPWVTK
jgi:hypothetical protein